VQKTNKRKKAMEQLFAEIEEYLHKQQRIVDILLSTENVTVLLAGNKLMVEDNALEVVQFLQIYGE
jgi:hypothetical protein